MRSLRPTPPPPRINIRIPIGVGTALWAVALVVLIVLRGDLPAEERWWIWTAAASTFGGLLGLWFVPRIERRRKEE